jgi:hypothetical protein
MKTSETGWGYRVLIYTWHHGEDSQVRAEMDVLLEDIARAIRGQVGGSKVTKGTGPLARPF